jgi:hypothetical protein
MRNKDVKVRFAEVVERFRGDPDVSLPQKNDEKEEKKKRFGSRALKIDGRIFAMLTSDGSSFVIKLPKSRVDQLVASRDGTRFDPRRNGHTMNEWIVMEEKSKTNWVDVAIEARDFSVRKKSF